MRPPTLRKGVDGESVAVHWSDLAQFKRTFTDPVAERSEQGLAKAGIETLHGRARFVGRNTIRVGERVIEARHIHIATGAMPAKLPIEGETCSRRATSPRADRAAAPNCVPR